MLKKDKIAQLLTQKSSLLLSIGAGILLIAGGIGIYIALLSRRPVGEGPLGANVIPQDALMTISVTTNTAQWEQLRKFGTPESQKAFDRFIGDVRDRVLTVNGYGYQQDIQPWIGPETTIAFLPNTTPTNSPSSPPTQQSVVMVLPIANPLKAKEILGQPRPLTKGKMVERNYKGISITETEGVPNQNYSVAVLGTEYLLVTNNPKATENAIDTYKGGNSILKTPGYLEALEQIKNSGSFAKIYVNIPLATVFTSNNSARPITEQNLEKLQQIQGLATNVNLEYDGMAFKSISWYKPDSEKKQAMENNAKTMTTILPNNTIMMMSGGNFKRLWQSYTEGANTNPLAPIKPEELRLNIKNSTGMDWDKDFVNWMEGEFALGVIPAQPGAKTPFGSGLLFLVQTRDRNNADKTLKQLDESMKTKQFKVESKQIKGVPVMQWTSQFGSINVTRGWLNNNIAFISLGAPIVESILPKPQSALLTGELFQKTVPLIKENNGHFFIDVNNTFNPKTLSLPELPEPQKVWVDAIQSIGVTTAVTSDRTTRYDMLVRFNKTIPNRPSISPTPSPNSSSSSTPSPQEKKSP
jgi:hypothetical protein